MRFTKVHKHYHDVLIANYHSFLVKLMPEKGSVALLSHLTLIESNFLRVSGSDKHLIMKTLICSELFFNSKGVHTTSPIRTKSLC